MSVNSAERGLPAMAGRVLLINNSTKHQAYGTGAGSCIPHP